MIMSLQLGSSAQWASEPALWITPDTPGLKQQDVVRTVGFQGITLHHAKSMKAISVPSSLGCLYRVT